MVRTGKGTDAAVSRAPSLRSQTLIVCLYFYLISDYCFFILACLVQAIDDGLCMMSGSILKMIQESVQQLRRLQMEHSTKEYAQVM